MFTTATFSLLPYLARWPRPARPIRAAALPISQFFSLVGDERRGVAFGDGFGDGFGDVFGVAFGVGVAAAFGLDLAPSLP